MSANFALAAAAAIFLHRTARQVHRRATIDKLSSAF